MVSHYRGLESVKTCQLSIFTVLSPSPLSIYMDSYRKDAQLLWSWVREIPLTSEGVIQCSGSLEDQKSSELLYRHLFDPEAMYYTQSGQTLCVCLCMHLHERSIIQRHLYYINQLFYVMIFEMVDASSVMMDNSSKGKIYNWRRSRHLGLSLRTAKILQHIHKKNLGKMMGFAICVEIFHLCTLSASLSECPWDFMVNHIIYLSLKGRECSPKCWENIRVIKQQFCKVQFLVEQAPKT